MDAADFMADPEVRQFVAGFASDIDRKRREQLAAMRPPPPPPQPPQRIGDDGIRAADILAAITRSQQPPQPQFPWGVMVGLGVGLGVALGIAIAVLASSKRR